MPTFDYIPTFANAAGTPAVVSPELYTQAAAIIGNFILNHYDYVSLLKEKLNIILRDTKPRLEGKDATDIMKIIGKYESDITIPGPYVSVISRIENLKRELQPFLSSQEQTLMAAMQSNRQHSAPIHEHLFYNISHFLPETSTNRELLQEMMNSIYRILELTVEPTSNNVLRISLQNEFSEVDITKIIKNYNTKANAKPGSKRPIPLEPQYKIEGYVLTFEEPTGAKGGRRKTYRRKTPMHRRKTQKRK
jgi:hypothetical protein